MNIGIVGCGGGYTGIYSAGFIKATIEFGIKPKVARGYSVNALNFALAIQYNWEDFRPLEAAWLEVQAKGPDFIFNLESFRRLERMWDALQQKSRMSFSYLELLGMVRKLGLNKETLSGNEGIIYLTNQLDIERILKSPIELQVVTLNKKTGKERVFSSREPEIIANPEILRKAISAAASFPGLFPPIRIGATDYCDAVITDVPLDVAALLNLGCERVFLFVNSSNTYIRPERSFWLSEMLEVLFRASNIGIEDAKYWYGEKLVVFRVKEIIKTVSRISFQSGDLRRGLDLAAAEGRNILQATNPQ